MSRPQRSRWRIALTIALCAGLLIIGQGCANGLFYRPNNRIYASPSQLPCTVEVVSFAAPDGPKLNGWWLRSTHAAGRRGSVVFCHGNTGNLTQHVRSVAWLPRYGFDVLVFDYRGYGESAGSPTRSGTVADAVAAIDLALRQDPERTAVFGHSLGGAIGVAATAQRPACRAVIAESTFASYRAIAADKVGWLFWLVPLLVSGGNDPEDVLDDLPPRPLFVIHGVHDHIVPLEHGQSLFDQAKEPKQLYLAPSSRHASPWNDEGAAFERMIVDFLSDALGG